MNFGHMRTELRDPEGAPAGGGIVPPAPTPPNAVDVVAGALGATNADLQRKIAALESENAALTQGATASAAAIEAAKAEGVAALQAFQRNTLVHAAALAAGILDTDTLALADLSTVTLGADGKLVGIEAALSTFRERKPHLFKAEKQQRSTTATTTTTPGVAGPSSFDARKAKPEDYGAELSKLVPGYSRR